jgi:ribose-phosphate pyrophosphokinase
MDLHADQIQGFFNVPVDALTAIPMLASYIKERMLKDVVIVAPDTGRAKTANRLAERLHAPLAIIHKRRPEHQKSEVMHVVGDVKGKTVVIMDDMIDTAGTATRGIDALREQGCNPDIYMVATHPILSGPAVEKMTKARFKEVVVMGTVPVPKEKMFPGLKVLSAGPIFGEAIKRNYENQSISSLFD